LYPMPASTAVPLVVVVLEMVLEMLSETDDRYGNMSVWLLFTIHH